MPRARLIVPDLPAPGETARVSGEEVSHARARRLAPGDPVTLLDGSGRVALGRVRRLGPRLLEVVVEEVAAAVAEGPPLALLAAGIRAERLAWLVEKATELGADRVAILLSERTQSFRAPAGLVARLTRVAREAAKQAERARWPEIAGPVAFSRAISGESSSSRLLLDPEGDPFPRALPRSPSALLVGPEGGWSDEERKAAREKGWLAIALPAGRLRAETAALAGLVLLRAAMQDRV